MAETMGSQANFILLMLLVACGLSIIEATCPDVCECSTTSDGLKLVNCAYKELTNVPSPMQTDVNILDLRGNRLQKISRGMFDGFYDLQILYLDDNLISDVEPLSFQDFKEVTLLSLTNNRLRRIHENAFAYVQGGSDCNSSSRSCDLDLRKNEIEVIESNAFAWITRLGVKIGETMDTTIKPYAFYGARRLQNIVIQNVTKLTLEKYWLSETDGIEVLHVKNSGIQDVVPFLFEGTSNVCMMVFEQNSFKNMEPFGFSGMKFAGKSCTERLRAQKETGSDYYSSLATKLAPADKRRKGLMKTPMSKGCGGVVVFRETRFPVLSTDMFRDTNLVHMELSGCKIAQMEANVFRGLDCLKTLDISHNVIQNGLTPYSFGSLNNLEHLIFTRNDFTTIHDNAFQGSQQLKRLEFILTPNKNFSLQSHAFSGLSDIGILTLSGDQNGNNFLLLQTGAFDQLVGVRNLTISHVRVPHLAQHSFYGVGQVKSLSFLNVQIDDFSSRAFGSAPIRTPISSVIISGDNTGISCDCETLKEVHNLNYMFEDYTIACNNDRTGEGFISQRQTLSVDLLHLKNCRYDDKAENSAQRSLSSCVLVYSLVCYWLFKLSNKYIL